MNGSVEMYFRVESKAEAKKARIGLGALGSQLRFHLHLRVNAAVFLHSLRVGSLYEVAWFERPKARWPDDPMAQ